MVKLYHIQHIHGPLTLVVVGMVLLTACSGDDGEYPPGPDTSVEVPSVSAELVDGVPQLEWEPVDGAVSYRIGTADSGSATDVPADICAAGTCMLTLMSDGLRVDGDLTVSAVTEDGAYSAPAAIAIDRPDPEPDLELDEHDLEVLLVYGWDMNHDTPYAPDAPPRTEIVQVGSLKEAQRVIEEAHQPGTGVISASLNLPARPSDSASSDDRYDEYLARGTWQVEEMGYDQLPGDPPGEGMVIASIEQSGIDANHPSLEGAVLEGHHVDGDGNGLTDPSAHATGVASLMVGQPAGAVPGIAPGATVYPIDMGDAKEGDLHAAIVHAVDAGADVINISQVLGCSSFLTITSCPTGLKAATDYAEENGVVVVAGAGNNGGDVSCDGTPDEEQWPAVLETVVSVGAYKPSREVWECTPNRPDVDLLAPGVDLFIATPDSYALADGTSFAAPLVSGLIAVILAEQPHLTPEDIREMLPQWRRADGQLSVFAALVSAGIIEADEFEPPEGEEIAAVYPYSLDLSFDDSHAIVPLIKEVDRLSARTEGVSLTPISEFADYGDPDYGEDGFEFGKITGLIFLHDDGSASATGWMLWEPRWAGEHEGYFAGHWEMCTIVPSFTPFSGRLYRWDIPVTVAATPASDAAEDGSPPEVELSFSLGIGATREGHGELPPATIPRDDLDKCADLNERFDEEAFLHGLDWRPWPEVEPFIDEHYAALEKVHEELIAATPLTLDAPIKLTRVKDETVAAEDAAISITYSTK